MTALHRPATAPALVLGFWSSLATTVLGIAYIILLASMIVTGTFDFPPADSAQMVGSFVSLLTCPLLVVLMASLHATAPAEKKVYSLAALAFTVLFAISVTMNRFTHLGVVRLSQSTGATAGIEWFLPYNGTSVMFGFEILGWGWFLGMAALAAAPLFSGSRRRAWLRWLFVLYGVLGLISAVSFLLASPLVSIGFAAWGLDLFVITALLAVEFSHNARQTASG